MSALPPKADIRRRNQDVCFGPKPEVVLTGRINSPVSGPRATWRGDFSRGLVYFIPLNSGGEARQCIIDAVCSRRWQHDEHFKRIDGVDLPNCTQ
jgi:hypothetical protein